MMIKLLTRIIRDRNFILILAVILGLTIGDWAEHLKSYTFYILAVVMIFSTTGLSTKALFPLKKMIQPLLLGPILNYFVFGAVIISLAYVLMPTPELFLGFVVIAATPPGLAVIPFSHILEGDIKYGIVGVLGAFISSIFLAPAIIGLLSNKDGGIDSGMLFMSMIKLVLIPMIISRFLLWEPIKPTIEKVRGKIVDWGFALLIFTAVGLNRQVFFSNFEVLFLVALVLFLSIFGLGFVYEKIAPKLGISKEVAMTQNLLLTIKSSGFAVVTALTLFGKEAAIPSAVMAIFVLLYLLYLSFRMEFRKKRIKDKG
jgi:BASS family bile acid:Na+ symporter